MNLFELAAVLTLDRSGYDSGLDDAENKANSFGSKLKSGLGTAAKVGAAAIGAASTAVVAFGKSSVDAGMTFDSSMSQVAATMGVTVDEIQNLRDFAQEMGSKTAFSASQAADALNYMALAGYDAETSMTMLPNVLNLAAAGGIDLAYASDMITDSQSALGLTLDETAELVDKMAKASSKSNTSVAQLGEAILTVGGTAKTLAGGTTELSTALGILADNGVKGAEGGTALRNIILSLSAPTDTAAKEMKKLGLEVFDAEGNMRPLNETFSDLDKALSTMTQGEQIQVLNKIFNKVDLKSVNALLANTGERFDELSGYIDGAWYSSEGLSAAFKANNLDIEAMQKRLEKVGVTAEEFTAALNASGGVAEVFAEEIWAATNELATNDEISKALGADLETLNAAFGATTGAAQAMADTQLDTLAGDITLFQSALEGAQIVVSDGLTPTLREFVQFGASGISQLTDAFKEGGLSGAVEALGGILSDGIAMITDMLPDIVTAGMGLIDAFVDGITQNIEPLTKAALEIVLKLIDGIGKTLPKLAKAGLEIIKTLAKGISQNIKTIVSTVVDVVIEIAKVLTAPDTLSDILDAGLQIVLGLAEGILEAIPKIIETLPLIIDNIVTFIVGAIPMIIDAGIQLLTALVDNLDVIIDSIVKVLPELIDGIVGGIIDAIPMIIDAGITLFVALVDNLPEIISDIVDKLPEMIDGIINGLLGEDNVQKIIDGGIKLFFKLVSDVPGIVGEIAMKLPQLLWDLANKIISLGASAMKAAGEALWNALVGGMEQSVDSPAIKSALSEVDEILGSKAIPSYGKAFGANGAIMEQALQNYKSQIATVRGGNAQNVAMSSGAQSMEVVVKIGDDITLGRELIALTDKAKRADGYSY